MLSIASERGSIESIRENLKMSFTAYILYFGMR